MTRALMRASGAVHNLRLVVARTGPIGFVELVAARAAPQTLSYQRTVILRAACAGDPQPQLAPRRVIALEPGLVDLFAELVSSGEPEIHGASESDLIARFEQGAELWLFHVDGRVAHLRWVSRGPLPLRGFALPLEHGERVVYGTVTVPGMRRRGLARAASAHVRHVLAGEGVTVLFGFVHGSNRRWLAGMFRMGYEPVATVHTFCLAKRRFVRVAPASRSDQELLERRGLRPGRWVRARD